jgi:FO synthase
MARAIDRAVSGRRLEIHEIATLFEARGSEVSHILTAADSMRAEIAGDRVTYVVNRNINYTNICVYRCQFCAFSKGRTAAHLRGKPYIIDTSEIARRAEEAWERGATEVCLQGGIHPDFTGATYEAIVAAIKSAVPSMHVHAFSPLEIWSGARTLGMPVSAYLERLIDAGLGSLPGTAAEVLDDDIRRIICPDKLTSGQWASVISAAHRLGLRTTATIMFGHVDGPMNWARHLDLIRSIQSETGGFTEFVPLPFVAQEAPMFLKGRSRNGPTFRECILMHAIARLVFGRLIPNIQVSWVKMGVSGAQFCLRAGANDLGGTLMNETITRSAGASHGQELPPSLMEAVIAEMERLASQRTTLYDDVLSERRRASFEARELRPIQFAQDGSDLIRGNAMAAVR